MIIQKVIHSGTHLIVTQLSDCKYYNIYNFLYTHNEESYSSAETKLW